MSRIIGLPQPVAGEPPAARDLRERYGHRCHAPHCPVWVPRGVQACRTHWLALPRADRQRLATSFRMRALDPAGYSAAVNEARRLLQEVQP